jgi:hypothetical protein
LQDECEDQLATRTVGGIAFGPEIAVPPDDPESEEEFVMRDDDVTQREDWIDPEHLPTAGAPAISVGLAAEE